MFSGVIFEPKTNSTRGASAKKGKKWGKKSFFRLFLIWWMCVCDILDRHVKKYPPKLRGETIFRCIHSRWTLWHLHLSLVLINWFKSWHFHRNEVREKLFLKRTQGVENEMQVGLHPFKTPILSQTSTWLAASWGCSGNAKWMQSNSWLTTRQTLSVIDRCVCMNAGAGEMLLHWQL